MCTIESHKVEELENPETKTIRLSRDRLNYEMYKPLAWSRSIQWHMQRTPTVEQLCTFGYKRRSFTIAKALN